jgi:PAS domain S-box-containing protein
MLGYTSDEMLSLTYQDLTPERWHKFEADVVQTQILPRGFSEIYEKEYRRKNGTDFPVELRTMLMRDAEGRPSAMWAIVRDISERKRAEDALRESDERLQQALDAAGIASWEWNPQSDVAVWNDLHFTLLGYEPNAITPSYSSWASRVLPEDLPRAEKSLRDMVEGGPDFKAEFRVLRPDGEIRWLEGRGRLRAQPDGNLPICYGVMIDITERKQAEEALRKSEQRLKRVYDSGLLGLVYWNMNGQIVDANGKFLEMIGYDRDDLEAGRIDWQQITPPEFAVLDQLSVAELMATGVNSAPFEKEYISKDGSRVPVLIAGAMLDEARFNGVAFVIDITERKQAQQALALAKAEAERANIAKSKFLAAASHDLRQPVQSLTLLLSLIKGQVKDKPKTADAVDMAKSAVDSLNSLLTGILDISKLDAGVVAPDIASVNLGETIDRLAKEYAPRAMAQGLTLRHVTSALWARTDANLMDRILRNLIENALRYTEKGGILIGLRRRDDTVRLDVIDTGIGIPADKQAEIFEEFRQLDNPARDASRGLGLGLAIVSRLAHLLGAPVEVASRLGRGTRFSLLLPLDRTEAPAKAAAPAFEVAAGRILIVEDDTLIRQAYEMMLKDWGYETLSAASGEEALERAAQANWRFDAIIADHRLGSGMTGNATATEIARRAGRSYPTVMVTGDTAKERLAEISASGFITLHKPVEADDLLHIVQSLLEGHGR